MGRSEKSAEPEGEGNLKMKSVFETASNTVAVSLEIGEVILPCGTSRSCFFLTNGAAGVGRPSSYIANCQLQIAEWKRVNRLQSAIGN
jgi:hypothetical protein